MAILNFESKICKGVKICNSDEPFFFFGLTGFRFMANRVIFDIGWVVDKASIYTMKGQQ